MRDILALLRQREPSAADLAAAIAALPMSQTDDDVRKAEATYRAALLDGLAGPELEASSRAVQEALRERDRVVVVKAELERSHVAAVERERAAALKAAVKKAEETASAAAQRLDDRYGKAVDEILDLVATLHAAEGVVAETNKLLDLAKEPRRVPGVAGRLKLGLPLEFAKRLHADIKRHNLTPPAA